MTSLTAIHDKMWPGGLQGGNAVGSPMVYVHVGVLMSVGGPDGHGGVSMGMGGSVWA